VLGRYAARINGLTDVFLTKLDVLSTFAEHNEPARGWSGRSHRTSGRVRSAGSAVRESRVLAGRESRDDERQFSVALVIDVETSESD
jgi:hypothetical protein